jgi:hypothetical protein
MVGLLLREARLLDPAAGDEPDYDYDHDDH